MGATHNWALAAHSGSWGHLFFFLVWISTLPHRGVPSNEKWQELQVQSSQSPRGLRTPGRHWSLVALSSLLPFPLKETAAPGAQGTLPVSLGRPAASRCLPASAHCRGWNFPPATTHRATHNLQHVYWRQWAVSARKAKGQTCFIFICSYQT